MNFLHRTTLEYVTRMSPRDMEQLTGLSFTDPDGNFVPHPDWLTNPDLSPVDGVPKKYWVLEGDVLRPMTRAERDVVDGQDEEEEKDRIQDQFTADPLFRGLARSIVAELNDLRGSVVPPLPAISMQTFLQRIRGNV